MASADLAEQVLAQLPVPVWVLDVDGVVTFANDAAADSLGYADPTALRGVQGHDTVHHHHPDGSDYPVVDCPLLGPGRTGAPAAADDQWFIRRDGSLFPIAWSAAPIALSSGRGTVLTFRDMAVQRARRETVRAREWAELAEPLVASPDDRGAAFARITAFAVTHAVDPALNPDRLARQHHLSLRALQTLFAEQGETPARFIREHRLAHARRLLLAGHKVGTAARNSGFTDLTTFTRAFRRAFGTTPTDFVERHTR